MEFKLFFCQVADLTSSTSLKMKRVNMLELLVKNRTHFKYFNRGFFSCPVKRCEGGKKIQGTTSVLHGIVVWGRESTGWEPSLPRPFHTPFSCAHTSSFDLLAGELSYSLQCSRTCCSKNSLKIALYRICRLSATQATQQKTTIKELFGYSFT